ncbi:MAG TPA: hypothetical protein VE891_04095 [Allosphingosinicella sp.]|nr:hypothetical protein [Allosphingosinicella sp.]
MIGMLFWLAAQAIGLGLVGGGHGWGEPFFFSMPLIVLYPMAFVAAFCSKAYLPAISAIVVVAAVALDFLVFGSFASESEYIVKMWRFPDGALFILLWLGLWAGWQILFVIGLVRRRHGAGRAEAGNA